MNRSIRWGLFDSLIGGSFGNSPMAENARAAQQQAANTSNVETIKDVDCIDITNSVKKPKLLETKCQ